MEGHCMKQIKRIIYMTAILSTSITITSFANRYNPETQIGPLTEEDIQNMDADLAERNYLSNQPSIEYDENTDSYYEDIYVSLSTKKNDHINTHNLKHGRRQENYFLDGRRE